MAEQTAFRNNALNYPIYGQPWAVVFPMLDADGDLVTGATTPDAEVSKNADTFADCTNESTEIATNSGVYYLLLTAAEMTADIVTVIAKSATAGMKTTVLTFYPRKLVSLRAGTAAGGAAGSITLDSGASAVDDTYNGCLVVGVLDGATEARMITDYTGSSKVAAVTPNWNTTPDSDDTFTIYLPEGMQIPQANVKQWNGTAVPSEHTAGYPVVTVKDGTGTGEINTNAGAIVSVETVTTLTNLPAITANWLTAAGIADNAITDAKVASDVTIASVTGSVGSVAAAVTLPTIPTAWITADGIATDALGALELAAGAASEIATAVRTELTTELGRIDAAVTTRASQASVDTLDDFVDTEVAAIKAKTDALPSDPADASDIAAAFSTVNSTLATIAAYVDTEVAAIKAKTDLIPASPAAVGSEMTLADGAITDAKFTIPTLTGPAAGPVGFITQLWRRFFKKATKNATTITTFADNGTTAVTTQTISDDGATQTQGTAT